MGTQLGDERMERQRGGTHVTVGRPLDQFKNRATQLDGYEFVEYLLGDTMNDACLRVAPRTSSWTVTSLASSGVEGDGHGLVARCRRGLVHRVTLVSPLSSSVDGRAGAGTRHALSCLTDVSRVRLGVEPLT